MINPFSPYWQNLTPQTFSCHSNFFKYPDGFNISGCHTSFNFMQMKIIKTSPDPSYLIAYPLKYLFLISGSQQNQLGLLQNHLNKVLHYGPL